MLEEIAKINKMIPKENRISDHRKFIQFFHDATVATRGFKPMLIPKDFGNLRRVLKMIDSKGKQLLSENELEQLALYFLANHRFKKFPPTISIFLSGGILNGLMNTSRQDEKFWKDLDSYSMLVLKKPSTINQAVVDRLADLKRQFSV